MTKSCLTTAGWIRLFSIYTLPHPGGCLVLVMAAVFARFNWTKTFLTTQSWLFLVLHVTAGSKYIIWLCLSCDISLQDLMAIICRARDCSKKQKRHKLKREKGQGEFILPSPTRKKKTENKSDQITYTVSLSAVACRKMDGVQSVVHIGFN